MSDIWNCRIWWSANEFKSCPAAISLKGECEAGKAGSGHCSRGPIRSSGHPLLCTPQTGRESNVFPLQAFLNDYRVSVNSPAFPQQLSHRTHRRNSRNSRCLPGQEASKDSHRRHAAWSQVQKSTWTWGHLPKAHHFPRWPGPGIPAQWSEEVLHTLMPRRLLFQRLPRNLCPSIK